jgi:Flp pilus assembly protein CpaB
VGYGSNLTTIGAASTSGSTQEADINWLTLIVTQRQALQLARAKSAGQLDVALRPG